MAKKTPEGRVKDAIKKKLDEISPDAFYYLPVSNGMGTHGIPDFVCCLPFEITEEMVGMRIGAFVGIEAKTVKGKLSPNQMDKLSKIASAAGVASVVWGSDDVEGKLSRLQCGVVDDAKPN